MHQYHYFAYDMHSPNSYTDYTSPRYYTPLTLSAVRINTVSYKVFYLYALYVIMRSLFAWNRQ